MRRPSSQRRRRRGLRHTAVDRHRPCGSGLRPLSSRGSATCSGGDEGACPVPTVLERRFMSHLTYEIVEHDGGWAYRADGVFSEPYPTREDALRAARRAAGEQRVGGEDEAIEYEDAQGRWHEELASGEDRPETEVKG